LFKENWYSKILKFINGTGITLIINSGVQEPIIIIKIQLNNKKDVIELIQLEKESIGLKITNSNITYNSLINTVTD